MEYSNFIRELRVAYEHRGGIKTLRLGRLEDRWFAQIQRDARHIIQRGGSSDVTASEHVTNWTRPIGEVRQFSLFNESGRSDEYAGDYGYRGDARKKHLVFAECQAITRFAYLFGTSLRNLRLNGMGTDSSLSAHEENSIEPGPFGTDHIVRFHLPVFTNDKAFVYLDDEKFHYKEGEVYFFHHGCVHSAANFGLEPRYHLVLDCFLDRELFSALFPQTGARGPDADYHKSEPGEEIVPAEPYAFSDFVCEDGNKIAHGIKYGRKAPTALTYYRQNYPSLFRWRKPEMPEPRQRPRK